MKGVETQLNNRRDHSFEGRSIFVLRCISISYLAVALTGFGRSLTLNVLLVRIGGVRDGSPWMAHSG